MSGKFIVTQDFIFGKTEFKKGQRLPLTHQVAAAMLEEHLNDNRSRTSEGLDHSAKDRLNGHLSGDQG